MWPLVGAREVPEGASQRQLWEPRTVSGVSGVMAYEETNRFWNNVAPWTGSLRTYTPVELVEASLAYFDWCADNPLYETDLRTADGIVVETPVAKMRAFTKSGLCVWLGISPSTLSTWVQDPDYKGAVEWINNIIYTQKLEGAAAGLLNANIIARDLGLSDSAKVDHTSSDGSMTPQYTVDWGLLDTETMKKIKASGIFDDIEDADA